MHNKISQTNRTSQKKKKLQSHNICLHCFGIRLTSLRECVLGVKRKGNLQVHSAFSPIGLVFRLQTMFDRHASAPHTQSGTKSTTQAQGQDLIHGQRYAGLVGDRKPERATSICRYATPSTFPSLSIEHDKAEEQIKKSSQSTRQEVRSTFYGGTVSHACPKEASHSCLKERRKQPGPIGQVRPRPVRVV